ncbi:Snrnp200 [Symbiodinium sp. KB8]|nr:Snrnp200 [Symbiodinium sp. KB8]
MFYISNQIDKKMRLVGLSASVVNAKELGSWFGVKSSHLFNFAPQVRPVPLEIRLQSFDVPNFSQRLLSMARPVYSAVASFSSVPADVRSEIAKADKEQKTYTPDPTKIKPAIIFVPSRKQAQLTAIDLLTFAAADGLPNRFRGGAAAELESVAANMKDPALRHTMKGGVAFLHEGMRQSERNDVLRLAEECKVSVLVATSGCAWGLPLQSHLVVLMDTQFYEGREHRYVDYPVADVLQMIGLASRPGLDHTGRCIIMCHTSRRETLKKFLYEPLPLESHLDHALHDHVNAEVVNRIIESKQDAVDYLTWTFFYRRLSQNPNYYNMQGISPQHLSDHLSELVESVVEALEKSRCIAVEDEMDLKPLNNGTIAAYYYVAYTTIELFASSLTAKTKLKALLEIVSSASEFDSVPVRHREDRQLRALAKRLPLALPSDARYHETSTKVNILLQCHFSRRSLPPDLRADQAEILQKVVPLLHAMVDVISSNGWLRPALAVMELAQMVVQGLWADKDSELKQLPHFTGPILEQISKLSEERKAVFAKQKPEKDASMEEDDESEDEEEDGSIESVYDLIRLDSEARQKALQGLSSEQVKDVARFCNRFPNVDVEFDVSVNVTLEREENTEGLEEWWLVVGDPQKGTLYAIRRITLGKRSKVPLKFQAPDVPGSHSLQLYFMCDSYVGCDQEYEFDLDVEEGESSDESSGEESEEEQ